MSPPKEVLKNKFLRPAAVIPLLLFGIGVVLWLGAASFVTYRILHPPFLNGGYGDTIITSAKEQLGVDPKSCCDAAFEDLRISDDAGVSVDAWFVPGTLPSAVLLIPSSESLEARDAAVSEIPTCGRPGRHADRQFGFCARSRRMGME